MYSVMQFGAPFEDELLHSLRFFGNCAVNVDIKYICAIMCSSILGKHQLLKNMTLFACQLYFYFGKDHNNKSSLYAIL